MIVLVIKIIIIRLAVKRTRLITRTKYTYLYMCRFTVHLVHALAWLP